MMIFPAPTMRRFGTFRLALDVGPPCYLGGCQNYGPVLCTLNIRCRIIIRTQKGTIILTSTHLKDSSPRSNIFSPTLESVPDPQSLGPDPTPLNLKPKSNVGKS